MKACVYKIIQDECSLFHGSVGERPSECDRNGLCICADSGYYADCNEYADKLPETGEE